MKIDQLIQELCPNGVEYKKLSDIATVARGVRVVRDQLAETGEIPVYQNSIKPLGYHDKSNVKAYSAFVIGAGAAGEIGFSDVDFWAADDCYYFLCPDNLNNRYLYFVLMNNQPLILSRVRKASIPRLSRTVIENLEIPVPPLEVQLEIVKIFDEYTESVTALQQELEKELTARKKQYEYYRDLLLDFGVHGGTSECEWRTIKEVCSISAGGDVPKDSFSKDKTDIFNIPIISNGIGDNALYGYTSIEKIAEPAVTVAARGTIGYAEYRDYPYYPIIRLLTVIPKEKSYLNTKYLYYVLQRQHYDVPKTGIPQLTSPMIQKISIPIPSIKEQERIVSILDRFDKLCNDISEGLPAEIEARRKQYEYYRDRLLSFKEVRT